MVRKTLVLFGAFLFSILFLSMVSAATTLVAPASLTNHSGALTLLNCTTAVTKATNVSIWYNATGVSDTLLTSIVNTTADDLHFNTSDSTILDVSAFDDANDYNFWCEVHNFTGFSQENSTPTTGITLDDTAPVIALPVYTNATAKKNTTTLTLNISVIDATAGLNWSMCLVDINGTNQSFAISNGWCNFTVGNLTNLADGYHIIRVYVNDTLNNLGLNNSFLVQADTTVPVVSASCSPSSVIMAHAITCSCSGSDATSGINSSLTTITNPGTSQAGTFTYSCSFTDNAGNSASASASYTVTSAGSSSGSSSSSSWTSTHAISDETFGNGYTKEMGVNQRVRVKVENTYHYIGVVSLTTTKATIDITSDPVQVILGIGEDVKVDVTDDGFYDMYIILNSIANNKADITMQKIYEEIPDEETPITTNGELEDGEEEGSLIWLWILIAVVVLAAIIGGGMAVKKGKRKQ